jgi:hypothetical protein
VRLCDLLASLEVQSTIGLGLRQPEAMQESSGDGTKAEQCV